MRCTERRSEKFSTSPVGLQVGNSSTLSNRGSLIIFLFCPLLSRLKETSSLGD